MARVFHDVAAAKVGRSLFNLSHERKFTAKMGYLYPCLIELMLPGDIFKLGQSVVLRALPLAAPIMHEVNVRIHTFAVPLRLLMSAQKYSDTAEWEDFMIRGSDGDTEYALPVWTPSSTAINSVWDHFYNPVGVTPDADNKPVAFPLRALNLIWNEYFRDVELQSEVGIDYDTALLPAGWPKDYFTSARLTPQRGTAVAVPISGVIDIDPKDSNIVVKTTNDTATSALSYDTTSTDEILATSLLAADNGLNLRWSDPALEVDLDTATTFNVNDLREVTSIQKWMERNMRAGTRHAEQLRAHWGVWPRDERLQRPEFVGSLKSPLIASEVLQTESSDATTAQGTMAGHGISVMNAYVSTYKAMEYTIMLSVLSVMPRPAYSQGLDAQFNQKVTYDFPFPEFARLGEQPVYLKEIYTSGVKSENETIFGYQGRYNEFRNRPNKIAGQLRSSGSLNYWTLSREFASAPTLGANFIKSRYSTGFEGGIRDDIFAVTTGDNLIITVGNNIKAIRPLPYMANPGGGL